MEFIKVRITMPSELYYSSYCNYFDQLLTKKETILLRSSLWHEKQLLKPQEPPCDQKSTNLNHIITFADFPDAGCLISKVSGRNHQTENINKNVKIARYGFRYKVHPWFYLTILTMKFTRQIYQCFIFLPIKSTDTFRVLCSRFVSNHKK